MLSMNIEDIRGLAELARLELTNEDMIAYQKDFLGILDYISTINAIEVEGFDEQMRGDTVNLMRDDEIAYQSGEFSHILLEAAPDTEGDYIKVAKIL